MNLFLHRLKERHIRDPLAGRLRNVAYNSGELGGRGVGLERLALKDLAQWWWRDEGDLSPLCAERSGAKD